MTWSGRIAFAALVLLAVVAWNLTGPPPPAGEHRPTLVADTPYGMPSR